MPDTRRPALRPIPRSASAHGLQLVIREPGTRRPRTVLLRSTELISVGGIPGDDVIRLRDHSLRSAHVSLSLASPTELRVNAASDDTDARLDGVALTHVPVTAKAGSVIHLGETVILVEPYLVPDEELERCLLPRRQPLPQLDLRA